MNAHRGETAVEIGGRTYTVAFDWAAIGALQGELGKSYLEELGRASDETDLDVLGKALEIGLRKHHAGEWTVETITAASPPVLRVVRALHVALNRANWGAAESPPDDEGAKANPPKPRRTWLHRLFAPRSKPD